MQKYVLKISVEASELIFTLEGSGVKSTKVSELTIESARTLTTLYYGSEDSEFSEESLLIGQEIEDRYLSSGEVKHHAFLFPVWYKAVGQYIYDNLLPHEISELINKIPNESIIKLELDDRLSRVPWELMYNGRNFLCLQYIFGRVKKGAVTPKPVHGYIPMLMIVDPSRDLPESQNEANYIISQLRGSKLRISRYGSEIRKRNYLNMLKSSAYRIVHYSGHSSSSREPGYAHHSFMDDNCYGWEIENLEINNPPLLVFSNSCQSAEDSLDNNETGNTSLAGSYLKAGAGSCIAAIWYVSDLGSTNFAADFYRYLLFGSTVGEAVLKARQSVFKRWGYQDFIWGSYILFGDPEMRIITG